ncbi:MAG: Ig-like domain-containing protein [Fibrobacteria bacterium]
MKKSVKLWMLAISLLGFSSLTLWNCNVSDTGETYALNVKLHDSLAVEDSIFKTVTIDIYDGNGNPVQVKVFQGPYHKSDADKLAHLRLATNPPDPFEVRITAYKDSNDYNIYKILFSKGEPQKLPTVYHLPSKPQPTSLPVSVAITNTNPLLLTVGGGTVKLTAVVLPGEASQTVVWTSLATDIARIDSGNVLTGLKAGTAKVTAGSAVDPSKTASLDVTVQDTPTVTPTDIIPKAAAIALQVGDPAVTLEAAVIPAEASQSIFWSLEAAGVAEIVNNNQIRGLKAGIAKVIATSAAKASVTGAITVTVTAPVVAPDSIALRMPVPMILAADGATGDISWAVTPAAADQRVQWSSSDISVAQITPDNKVKSYGIGTATITGKSQAKPSLATSFQVNVVKPVKVDAITLTPKILKLYTGGAEGQLTVAMTGNDSGARYSLSSANALIASVNAAGAVKGLKAGATVLTAAVVGYPAVSSICSVTVITDPPVVTLTPDQTVVYGGEASFKVAVTQQYGTLAEIKADMDGNGTFEKSVLDKDTATFSATYTEAKIYNLSFEIKDSEGNVVALSRKVTVTAVAAPTVKIIDPSAAITVNTGTYTVKFTVKDPTKAADEAKDSVVTLASGPNTIKVTRNNAGGTGSAQVVITLDNTAPGTPTFVAQPGSTTDNTPTWTWTAVTGAAKYQVRLDDGDFTKTTGTLDVTGLTYTAGVLADGPHTLYLRSLDNLGNSSTAATQQVTVKTSLPATPVLVSSPAATSSVRTPEWKWKSGDAAKGNGTYKVWLNDVAQPNATTAGFKPTTALEDGKYILKVKELDALGQESAAFLTFASIAIDGTKPIIAASYANGSVTTLATTTKVTVTGSILDGLAGSGIQSATYALSGKTTKTATLIPNPGDFNLAALVLVAGLTNMTITATDLANNTQTYTMGFNVTLKAPVVKITSPNDGYVSNSSAAITVSYTVDGIAATPVTCVISEPTSMIASNSKACAVSDTNEAGIGTDTRTYHRVNRNVVFFKPSGKPGSCSGSDWENACAFRGYLESWEGKTIWLAAGEYNLGGETLHIGDVKIYGGLTEGATETKVTGTPYSHLYGVSINGRGHPTINLYGPTLEVNHLSFSGNFRDAALQLRTDVNNRYYFNDCKFYELVSDIKWYGLAIATGSTTFFTRCVFDNTGGDQSMIYFNGGVTGPNGEVATYLTFASCTFKKAVVGPDPIREAYDIENGVDPGQEGGTPNTIRITPAGSSDPYIRGSHLACGLPGKAACP